MIIREAYRDIDHSVCRDHYSGDKPLPSDTPSFGPVQDARDEAGCEFCRPEPKAIKINVHKRAGGWFGARWIDGEYDGCDALDIDGEASDAEAIEYARSMPLESVGARTVRRIDDT